MTSGLETYLARLRFELRKRGLVDARIVEEACGHLTAACSRMALCTAMAHGPNSMSVIVTDQPRGTT